MSDDIVDPVPAVAVSPVDQSSDREQSDADQAATVKRLDQLITSSADRVQSDADQVLTVERLDRLVAASEELSRSAVSVADATAAEIAFAKLARQRFMKGMVALGAVVLLLLAPMLVLLLQGAEQRREIRDCVDPSGACFKKDAVGAKRIQKIEDIIVLAVACAGDPKLIPLPFEQRIVAVRKCIDAGITK